MSRGDDDRICILICLLKIALHGENFKARARLPEYKFQSSGLLKKKSIRKKQDR